MDGVIKYDIRKERLAKSQSISPAMQEDFRDSIATVDEKGKRIWMYPKKPSGNLHRWRIVVTVVLLGLLFAWKLWQELPAATRKYLTEVEKVKIK